MSRPPVALLGVGAALVAGVALAQATLPTSVLPDQGRAVTRAVTDATRVCPFLESDTGVFGTRVSLAAPTSTPEATSTTPSSLEVVAVPAAPPEAAPVASVDPSASPSPSPSGSPSPSPSPSPSELPTPSPSATPVSLLPAPGLAEASLSTPADSGALALTAAGPVAAGFEASQLIRGNDGVNRGLAGVRCPEPTTSSWFLGASSVVGADAVLRLANDDDAAAVIDISFLGADGRREPSAGQGLQVPARTYLDVRVDDLVPDVEWLAVHVEARSGRVAPALLQRRGTADLPLGIDFVPDAGEPSRSVVLPGVPAGASGYRLLLANPTESELTASVQAVTAEGQFVPAGLEAVPVPAQSVVALDATDALSSQPSTLRVRSDGGEVLAAVSLGLVTQISPLRELAYVGAGSAINAGALVTEVTSDGGATSHRLILSALDAAATVVVTPLPRVGVEATLPAPRRVLVPAGTTVELALTSIAGSLGSLPVWVTVEAGGGQVVASSVHSERGGRGTLLTVMSLQSAPSTVRLPDVRQDPGVSHRR